MWDIKFSLQWYVTPQCQSFQLGPTVSGLREVPLCWFSRATKGPSGVSYAHAHATWGAYQRHDPGLFWCDWGMEIISWNIWAEGSCSRLSSIWKGIKFPAWDRFACLRKLVSRVNTSTFEKHKVALLNNMPFVLVIASINWSSVDRATCETQMIFVLVMVVKECLVSNS